MLRLYGEEITLIIDKNIYALNETPWTYGSHDLAKLLETYTITDLNLSTELLKEMNAGRLLKAMDLTDEAEFSLRGITAAMAAIERHIKGRT